MTNDRRTAAYARDNHQLGDFRPTPTQRRRLAKKARRVK